MNPPSSPLIASASQTVGPFFHFGIATNVRLGCLVYPDTKGERVALRLRVCDGQGVPVPDALVELWHADSDGVYVEADWREVTREPATPRFCGFGRLPTDATGVCAFETIRPGPVADGQGGRQAPHMHVCIFMRGLLRPIYTRLYFEADPSLATDPVLALVPEARRATLLARPDRERPGTWAFDVHLQGDQETVFFDL